MEISQFYYNARKRVAGELSAALGIKGEDMPYVKCANITPTSLFTNEVAIYFDEASLPISITSLFGLKGKYVLYGIYCNDKIYIGKTNNLGWRICSHLKDTGGSKLMRKDKGQRVGEIVLHREMVNTGECLLFVLCICDSQEILDKAEHIAIVTVKDEAVRNASKYDEEIYKFNKETKKHLKESESKYCFNKLD